MSKQKYGYAICNRKILMDDRLSWKAKGIYGYICSLEDSPFKVSEAVKDSPQGISALQSGIKELVKYGYLKREGVYKLTKKHFDVFPNFEELHKAVKENGKQQKKDN